MPFIWAKKTSLFDEVSLDMFYPQGIQLSRKEKLSLIWLASNYDPEKYKKIISSRDCEGANIVQICSAITNPKYPHALRLSAQLLLGTVRVYRTKTRMILQLAESMMLKLSSMLKEATLRNSEPNVIGLARSEAITMVDGCISIIDYSLEPVYYDPQMIMHMNEDDMFLVNGSNNSPFASPIKINNKKEPTTPKKASQSPLVVSNRQISITEDLLSPSRPIQVPGEDDFGTNTFGPAPDGFLEDLNLEGLPDELLPPVFEEEELNDIEKPRYNQDEVAKKRRRLIDDIMIDELGDQAREAIEPVDLDQLLQDAKNINFPTLGNKSSEDELRMGLSEPSKLTPIEEISFPAVEDGDLVEEIGALGMDTGLDAGVLEEEQTTFTAIREGGEQKTVIGEPVDWENQLFTPADAIILKPTKAHPKKKRKLQIDKNTTLSGEDIRNNLANPDSLVTVPISAGTMLPGAKELFNKPLLGDMRRHPSLQKWWDNNACLDEGSSSSSSKTKRKRLRLDRPTSSEEDDINLLLDLPKSPEIQRNPDDTPSSIDIQRAESHASLRSLEKSRGSTMLINQTPIDDASSSKSLDIQAGIDEDLADLPARSSPRVSGIGALPDIVEADLDDIPELDPIQEIDQTLVNDPIQPPYDTDISDNQPPPSLPPMMEDMDDLDPTMEQSFFTIGDDDDHLPKHLSKYQQRIASATMTTSSALNAVSFFELFPHKSTRRRDATLAFYTCLNLTKNGLIDVEQRENFGDILLWKKAT
eukprot:TCONS_00065372-protein